MLSSQQMVPAIGVVITCLCMTASSAFSHQATQTQNVTIPPDATALEGIPAVRIDAAQAGTTRRVLGAAEAARDHLKISIVDGQLYWTSRGNSLLRLNTSGGFTYLSSEPGKYIRLTRVNEKISYVEHVDLASESVTWWGELKVVIGK